MDLIEINGNKYAKNENALVNTLFDASGSAVGIFKKYKNKLELRKASGELFAAIINTGGGCFPVTAREESGKKRYMNALTSADESFLDFDKLSYLQKIRECERVLNLFDNKSK